MTTLQIIVSVILALIASGPASVLGFLAWMSARKSAATAKIEKERDQLTEERKTTIAEHDGVDKTYTNIINSQNLIQNKLFELDNKSKENYNFLDSRYSQLEARYSQLEGRYALQTAEVTELKSSIVDLKYQNTMQTSQITGLQNDNRRQQQGTTKTINRVVVQLKELFKSEIEAMVKEALELIRQGLSAEAVLQERADTIKKRIDAYNMGDDPNYEGYLSVSGTKNEN